MSSIVHLVVALACFLHAHGRVLYTTDMPPTRATTHRQHANEANKTVLVLVAPSIWDPFYKDTFKGIIDFQIRFAKQLLENGESVVVVTDKHTISYVSQTAEDYDREQQLKQAASSTHRPSAKAASRPSSSNLLPMDVVIEGNLYDPVIRDYAMIGRAQTKFDFVSAYVDPAFAKETDKAFAHFLKDSLDFDMRDSQQSSIILNGAHVVDNEKDKAIISHDVIDENAKNLQDWAVMIQLFNFLGRTVFATPVRNSSLFSTVSFDHLMSFVDDTVLALTEIGDDEAGRQRMIREIQRVFPDVKVLDVPTEYTAPLREDDDVKSHRPGVCGLYTNMLVTDANIYQPVFGNDADNWKRGLSTMVDKHVVTAVSINVKRHVVPVTVPRVVCASGLSLKNMVWVARGPLAGKLVQAGRRHMQSELSLLKERRRAEQAKKLLRAHLIQGRTEQIVAVS